MRERESDGLDPPVAPVLMQSVDESLRFFQWSDLVQPPPLSSLGPPPSDPVEDLPSGHAEPVSSPPRPLPVFAAERLRSARLPLSSALSHDEAAPRVLRNVLEDIEGGLIPKPSSIDVLVVQGNRRFSCPFSRCLKKTNGWDCIRNARDHIWIDHLYRRFQCTWDGWYAFRQVPWYISLSP